MTLCMSFLMALKDVFRCCCVDDVAVEYPVVHAMPPINNQRGYFINAPGATFNVQVFPDVIDNRMAVPSAQIIAEVIKDEQPSVLRRAKTS